ncbi:MAG: hypothetical protein V3574_04575 [Candidatus Moraniibacteriota bacterium]
MAKENKLRNGCGSSSKHVIQRLRHQYRFNGDEKEAKKFIALCRKRAGKNGNLVISAENLKISRRQMSLWNLEDNKYFIVFAGGKGVTILSLVS